MLELSLATEQKVQAIDVTDLIAGSELEDGLLWVASPHTTVALFLGENDPEMLQDYERVARELFAPYEPFRHHRNDKPNAAAHLWSSLVGTQLLVPVTDGVLGLGTYQRIILLELDGPHPARRIQAQTVSPGLHTPEVT